MTKRLVSIVTPCYNTAKFLPKLLDSILRQTYPNIEMIAVDDGSTDNIRSIILEYVPKFIARGFELKYIYQDNRGQSSAIQNGITYISGEYLVWPDSDDYFASQDSIYKMVNRFCHLNDEFGMVRTEETLVADDENNTPLKRFGLNGKEEEDRDLFFDCLYNQNDYYYCSGAYMIKTHLLSECSDLPIFTSKDAGQNWQLMLPILYHYRCSTIKEPLYNVLSRVSSHCRSLNDYDKIKKRVNTYMDTIFGTLDRIIGLNDEQRNKYKTEVRRRYFHLLFQRALKYGDKMDVKEAYTNLKNLFGVTTAEFIKYVGYRFRIYNALINLKMKLLHG